MKQNMGTIDRILRAALAVVVAVLIITGTLTGAAAIILGIFAGIFLLTSIVGFCPVYLPIRLSTRGKPHKE